MKLNSFPVLEVGEGNRLVNDYLGQMTESTRVASYLGPGGYLRRHTPRNLDFSWGWKDLRNTYTLPLWLDLFSEARVIHIYRHGVDVAGSLQTREQATLAQRISARYKRLRPLHRLVPKRSGFVQSPRCLTLGGGFSLWEEYTTEAARQTADLGECALTLRYEGLLEEPKGPLRSLADSCGVPAPDGAVARITGGIRRDRAYAYRRDPELSTFAETVEDRLQSLGYGA